MSRTPVHRFALAPIAVQSVQVPALFGISKSAAGRIIQHLGPPLVLQPRSRFREDAALHSLNDACALAATVSTSRADRCPGEMAQEPPHGAGAGPSAGPDGSGPVLPAALEAP